MHTMQGMIDRLTAENVKINTDMQQLYFYVIIMRRMTNLDQVTRLQG